MGNTKRAVVAAQRASNRGAFCLSIFHTYQIFAACLTRCYDMVYNGRMDIKQIAQRVIDGQAEDGDAKAMAEYILRSIAEDKAGLLRLLDTIKTTHSSVGYEWADKDTPGR